MSNKTSNDSVKRGHRQLHVRVKTARGRKRSSTQWLQRQLNDPYVLLANKEGYRSRAAYKLIEMDNRFKFIKQNSKVVDLGAAPGGWTQVAVKRALKGKVVGIDLQAMEPISGATLLQADFTENEALTMLQDELGDEKVDVVLSDMAAPSCGHAQTDHLRIVMLCELAFDFAESHLAEGGTLVAKILKGGTERELLTAMKRCFKTVKHVKPEASRKDSAEMYVIATGFRVS